MHQMISRGHGGIAHGLCRARQGNERMHDGWEYRGRAAFRFHFAILVLWEGDEPKGGAGPDCRARLAPGTNSPRIAACG